MKKKIKHLLAGHSYPQEYLCMAENSLLNIPFLTDGNIQVPHLFIGYKPAIIATLQEAKKLCIVQNIQNEPVLLGEIYLNSLHQHFKSKPNIFLYTGKSAESNLLSGMTRQIANWAYNKRSNKQDALYLTNDLYNQVRLLYSIPRKISVIVTGNEGLYNVCPTDLHGSFDPNHYVISLRINGKIHSQVNSTGKLLLADVDASRYKEVYQLGKNHMQDFKSHQSHPILSSKRSSLFNLPIPMDCISYKELELIESIQIGVHNVLLFTIRNHEAFSDNNRLMHIHAYYAEWRKRRKLNDHFLIR